MKIFILLLLAIPLRFQEQTAAKNTGPSLIETMEWIKFKFEQNADRRILTDVPDTADFDPKAVAYTTLVPQDIQFKNCQVSFRILETVVFPFPENARQWNRRYSFKLDTLDPGQVEVEDSAANYQRIFLRTYRNEKLIQFHLWQTGQTSEPKSGNTSRLVFTLPAAGNLPDRIATAFKHAIRECDGKERPELFQQPLGLDDTSLSASFAVVRRSGTTECPGELHIVDKSNGPLEMNFAGQGTCGDQRISVSISELDEAKSVQQSGQKIVHLTFRRDSSIGNLEFLVMQHDPAEVVFHFDLAKAVSKFRLNASAVK